MESTSRLVLDTNILISALITDGVARKFLRAKLNYAQTKLVISNYIIAEVEEVLKRNKFSQIEIIEELWELIKQEAIVVAVPTQLHYTVVRDPKDHPILLTAQESSTKTIVTGDQDLLDLKQWKGIRIVKMNQLMDPT